MEVKVNGVKQVPTDLPELQNSVKVDYPYRESAFDMNDEMKIKLISEKFAEIMKILGLDLKDESISNTPTRIAKMYVNEIFGGLNPKKRPEITLFKNSYKYQSPLIQLNIPFTSFCEHHFVPIVGEANVAYIPKEYVIGLSKIHRIVDYYAKRPQIQERLTKQIHDDLIITLKTKSVGVVLKAAHSCISCRGIKHQSSSTVTSEFSGEIKKDKNLINYLMRE